MIEPAKYLDLNTCVVGISAEVLVALRLNQFMRYDELLGFVQSKMSDNARFNFPLSLDLLFLLGLIEYHDETDSIGITDKIAEATR
jgi:hypothetical protein